MMKMIQTGLLLPMFPPHGEHILDSVPWNFCPSGRCGVAISVERGVDCMYCHCCLLTGGVNPPGVYYLNVEKMETKLLINSKLPI